MESYKTLVQPKDYVFYASVSLDQCLDGVKCIQLSQHITEAKYKNVYICMKLINTGSKDCIANTLQPKPNMH